MARLGDICEIVSGTTPKTNVSEFWDGDINWITPAELNDDTTIIYESQRKITEKAVQCGGLRPFPAGTVILSSRAPIGKVAIAGVEMYCNQGFKNLICSENIHNKYLFWFLKSKTDYLNSLGRGATFKEISKGIVESIDIPLPALETQKYIATLLDKISNLISLRKQQLAKLDELVKAQFVEMFGDPVMNPKVWPLVPLLEMGNCKNGMNFHTGDSGIEIYCLGVGDFKNFSAIHDISKLSKVSLNEMPSSDYLLKDEDIVFVRSNGNKALVGRCLAVYPGETSTTFSGFCIRYRKYSEMIQTEYLLQVLKSNSMRKKMAGRGANIQNLNQQILASLVIPVPPQELQRQFAFFVNRIEKTRLTIQQGLDKLEMMKKALMQAYWG